MKLAQRSFGAGEVAPALYARTDVGFYGQALRTLRNAYVMRTGGIQSRPGTIYKGTTKSSGQVRLIACVFADDQNYVLEFGNLYVRFWKDGSPVTAIVTGAWANATAYTAGTVVSYSGTNYVCLQSHTSATAVNQPTTGSSWADYWYALSGTIYEIPTPYTTAQLSALQVAQVPGQMYIVHPSYPPALLTRLSNSSWDLANISFSSGGLTAPTGVTGTWQTYGISTWTTATAYAVQAKVVRSGLVYYCYAAHTSGASTEPGTGASWTSYWIKKEFIANGTGYWYVITAYDANGVEGPTSTVVTSEAGQNALSPNWVNVTIGWSAVTGASGYRLYRGYNASDYRLLADLAGAGSTAFTDSNPLASAYIAQHGPAATPTGLFGSSGNYPSSVAMHQQRLMLAGTNNNPDTVWASVTGEPYNFAVRNPIQDDDAIQWRQLSNRSTSVRHLLAVANRLFGFTNIGEFVVSGADDGVLRPGEINPVVFSYNGSASVAPLGMDDSAIYLQARGSRVLMLTQRQQDGTTGSDLSLLSAHLVDGYSITDWAFQEIPHQIAWMVRSDGTLLSMSYVPEAGITGWARHDTDGVCESVCVVPEGSEDAVYIAVRRTVNGSTVRYVERLANRTASNPVLSDAAKQWTVLSTNANSSLYFSSVVYDIATNQTYASAGTSPTSAFSPSDVGSVIDVYTGGAWGSWTIDSYVSASEVQIVRSQSWSLPASVTRDNWAYRLGGLSHLNAKSVSVVGNNIVLASPNNASYATQTVTSGLLANRYGYTGATTNIIVGLPYTVDVETLDIDQGRGSIKNDNIRVGQVFIWIDSSGSFYVAPKAVTGTSLATFEQYTPMNDEEYPLAAGQTFTGVAPLVLQSTYTKNGRIFIRQPDAVPLTILAVVPEGLINGRG